ncbi:sigma-70 family RNA polymerase sigma factor [bacterium]|nr:sigma-70 family RNA polymerase sigma factor [bacterium]
MNSTTLHKKYFAENTVGSKIIRKFYFANSKILVNNNYADFNDLVHEIYLNISKINFDKIQNEEHYIHRAIKVQCWSVLDKIYSKKGLVTTETRLSNERSSYSLSEAPSGDPDPQANMESAQLMTIVTRFRKTLAADETKILNTLIDEQGVSFVDMARRFQLNENTIRTKVRRLRISFEEYLRENGQIE